MKKVVKEIAKKMGVYDVIKWSRIYSYFYELINFDYKKSGSFTQAGN